MSTVIASDGVTLAVHAYTDVDPRRPTILAIHGYPDNHHVWDGVAHELVANHPGRYNVVAYDVRGAGGSSAPAKRSGYRVAQLVADVGAVIDHLGVEQVHLLGHDWGSVQGWAAVTDVGVAARIGSYTSISGPHLDYVGRFLRSPRDVRTFLDVVRQVIESTYIWLFLTPWLPEAIFRSGIGGSVVHTAERIGRSGGRRWATRRFEHDYLNGLNLYRANMPRPLLKPANPLPSTEVAVQVLAPRRDIFVSSALQRFTGAIPDRHRVLDIDGGHWVVTDRPEIIARLTGQWVDESVAGRAEASGRDIPDARQR